MVMVKESIVFDGRLAWFITGAISGYHFGNSTRYKIVDYGIYHLGPPTKTTVSTFGSPLEYVEGETLW